MVSQDQGHEDLRVGLRCNVWQIVVKESGGKDANNTPWRNKLTDDAHILEEDLAKDGSYNYDCERKRQCPSGDNSNSQYGVLGMWAAARSISYEVPDQYWWTVMKHWMDCQNVDGGWGYVRNNASSGTMTAAGVATMFVCYDYLYSSSFVACKSVGDFKPIQRGLDYFDRNFANILSGKMAMTTTVGDPFYFLYGIERCGLASGYKYFGTADWYKLGAEYLLKTQQPKGNWVGGIGGADVSTSFALLFLVRGRNAVLFNKLEFPSLDAGKVVTNDWRCRPRDLAMLTQWISLNFESTRNWQIINLKTPVTEWHDVPILYIAGSLEPSLTAQDIEKLRQYVLQGGTIFSCTECDNPAAPNGFHTGIRDIYAKKLFPEYEMVEVPATHELYQKKIEFDLKGKPKFFMISNGVRPLVIHTDEDLPKSWQLNQIGTAANHFQAATNLFMYLTDKGKLRLKAAHAWPDEAKLTDPQRTTIKIVRLKWGRSEDGKHYANWNPEPLSLQRFARLFNGKQESDLQDHVINVGQEVELQVGDPVDLDKVDQRGAKFAILSGVGTVPPLTSAEEAAIKNFVTQGNFLLVEAAGGDQRFYASMETSLTKIYGAAAINSLASTSDVFNMKMPDGKLQVIKDPNDNSKNTLMLYRGKTLARVKPRPTTPPLKAILAKNNPVIFVSQEDISNAGGVGYQSMAVDGYDPGNDIDGSAYRLLRNLVLYACFGVDGQPTAAKAPPPPPPNPKPGPVAPTTNPTTTPANPTTKPTPPATNKAGSAERPL